MAMCWFLSRRPCCTRRIHCRREPVHTLYFDFEWGGYGAEVPLRQLDLDGRVRQMAGWLRHDLGTGTLRQ